MMTTIITILKALGFFILTLVGLATAGKQTVDSGKDLYGEVKTGIKTVKSNQRKSH